MTRPAKTVLAAAFVALFVGGCGGSAAAGPSKPAGWQRIDTPGADTGTWCDHGFRLWLSRTAQGGVSLTSQPDPTCKEQPR